MLFFSQEVILLFQEFPGGGFFFQEVTEFFQEQAPFPGVFQGPGKYFSFSRSFQEACGPCEDETENATKLMSHHYCPSYVSVASSV